MDGTVSEPDSAQPPLSTPWGTAVRVALGAQGSATLGAVLDLDEARAWLSAQANANQSGIDLVFMYYSGGFHLNNAVEAKAAGIANSINMTNSYDASKIKDIGVVKISAKPVDQESARRVFAAAVKIRGSVISAGDRFLAESTEGKLAMITVVSIVGLESGASAEVDINPVTIP